MGAYPNGLSFNNSGAYDILSSPLCGHFVASNSFGVGGSLLFGKHTDNTKLSSYNMGPQVGAGNSTVSGTNNPIGANYQNPSYALVMPNPVDSGIYMAPLWIHHNNTLRGYFKGLWCPLQHLPLNHDDTFSGTGPMAGKSFVVQNLWGSYSGGANYQGQIFVETSSTWS